MQTQCRDEDQHRKLLPDDEFARLRVAQFLAHPLNAPAQDRFVGLFVNDQSPPKSKPADQ